MKREEGSVLALGTDKVYDSIVSHNYENRTIIIGEVDSLLLEYAVEYILKWNRDDMNIPKEKRRPIKLHINSPGGSVYSGMNLINVIQNSKTPVNAIVQGYAMSMGMLILIACHKRYAFADSICLLHDGSTGGYNSTAKMRDLAKFTEKQEERTKNFIIGNTKITEEVYEDMYTKEWYMYADEAKEVGVIDGIVGIDVTLDDIL